MNLDVVGGLLFIPDDEGKDVKKRIQITLVLYPGERSPCFTLHGTWSVHCRIV